MSLCSFLSFFGSTLWISCFGWCFFQFFLSSCLWVLPSSPSRFMNPLVVLYLSLIHSVCVSFILVFCVYFLYELDLVIPLLVFCMLFSGSYHLFCVLFSEKQLKIHVLQFILCFYFYRALAEPSVRSGDWHLLSRIFGFGLIECVSLGWVYVFRPSFQL